MKKVLLDTSVIIESIRLKDKSETAVVKLTQGGFQLAASIITYFEAYAGKSVWEKPEARQTVETLLAGMELIGLETTIAQKAGELRAQHSLSAMDALIAATAIQHQLPLVTINLKDFAQVPGLLLFVDSEDSTD
jgi:predicted nucleic acid-binding protein